MAHCCVPNTQQKELDTPPPQNNYEILTHLCLGLTDEMYVLRKSVEEMSQAIYDLTELIGIQSKRIEEWVGVAEEDPLASS